MVRGDHPWDVANKHDRRSGRSHPGAQHSRRDAGAEGPAATRQARGIDPEPLERDDGEQDEPDQSGQRARGQRGEHPDAERRAQHRAEQQRGHPAGIEVGTQRDEDDDRREHGVDGQQHDSVGRGHDERQEGQRDEAVAEAGEPEDEERAGDDGGAEGPVEAHAGGGSATARPETQPRAG